MAADGFGDNAAALASHDLTYRVRINDGRVYDGQPPPSSDQEEDSDDVHQYLTLTASIGSFALTQASRITAQAVATTQLHGIVIDWGCGGGILSLLAACQPTVHKVWGFDYDTANLVTAQRNAKHNQLQHKVTFCRCDSFQPLDMSSKDEIQTFYQQLLGQVDFVIANPPASQNDDGFSFRRRILKEAIPFLKPNGRVLLQALSYYGSHRFIQAAQQATEEYNYRTTNPSKVVPSHKSNQDVAVDNPPTPHHKMEYQYLGVIQSSEWMELGSGPGGYVLKSQLMQYCKVEESSSSSSSLRLEDNGQRRGGGRYYCGPSRKCRTMLNGSIINHGNDNDSLSSSTTYKETWVFREEDQQTAKEVLTTWESSRMPPLCQWHVHALEWKPVGEL
jgi:SAM-dependent methyltransferase